MAIYQVDCLLRLTLIRFVLKLANEERGKQQQLLPKKGARIEKRGDFDFSPSLRL